MLLKFSQQLSQMSNEQCKFNRCDHKLSNKPTNRVKALKEVAKD